MLVWDRRRVFWTLSICSFLNARMLTPACGGPDCYGRVTLGAPGVHSTVTEWVEEGEEKAGEAPSGASLRASRPPVASGDSSHFLACAIVIPMSASLD